MKKNMSGILAFFCTALMLLTSTLSAQFSGGTGTQADPYQITTPADLNTVRNYLGGTNAGKYFKLMNDIDLTAYLANGGAGFSAWGAAGWLPIGNVSSAFSGKFLGNGHKVSNLFINRAANEQGLFGVVSGAQISKLGIVNANITGVSFCGSLTGKLMMNSSINEVFATGIVKASTHSGGLIGLSSDANSIENCFSQVAVTITGYDTGGLVGKNENVTTTIKNCYSTGKITAPAGAANVGALNGFGGTVTNCYWDKESSSYANSSGSGILYGKTTAEMKAISTFAGWDFLGETANGANDYWGINPTENNGYPFLKWQGYTQVIAEFAGGTGTSMDPFQIAAATHLNSIRNYLGNEHADKYFKLLNDIDLTSYLAPTGAGYNNGAFWRPIATTEAAKFKGKFEGYGFIIKNLKINLPDGDNTGLFGYLGSDALVKNVNLVNADVTGKNATGILVGANRGGLIINTSSSGRVYGALWVGGLVGFNESDGVNGLISKCYSTASVFCTGNTAGGLAGQNGTNTAGNAIIENSYATGRVSCVDFAGGLVGHQLANGIIRYSYSTGKPTNSGNPVNKGGLAGYLEGSVVSSYWDKETSGIATSVGSDPSCGKTTAEMKTQSTYANWDFTTPIWHLTADNQGYPHLAWQNTTATVPALPSAIAASGITTTAFTANWYPSWNATGYFLDVATDAAFTAFVSGYNNFNAGTSLSKELTGLTHSTTYYYRVRAANTTGNSTNSNTISAQTKTLDQLAPAVTAVTGTSVFLQNPMPVTATVTDETGVALVEGFYKLTGQTAWTSFAMTRVGTTSDYTGTIPAQNTVITGKVKFKTTDTMTPTANTGESQEYDIAWTDEMAIGWGSMTSNTGQAFNLNPNWKMGMDYNFGTKTDLILKKVEFAYSNYVSGLTSLDVPWNIQKVTQTNASTITETGILGTLSGTATIPVNGPNGIITVSNNTKLTGLVAVTMVFPKSFYVKVDQAGTNGHRYGAADITSPTLTDMGMLQGSWCVRMIVGVSGSSVDDVELLPGKSELAQNYPNPFNPTTTINFFNSMSGDVKLTVMNAKGEVVSKLLDSKLTAGNHSYSFNGAGLNSGVYFYKLETPNGSMVKKMIMLK